MCIGMKVNKNLIGNLAILLAERCKPLSHTKLLKLLYLIDEESTNRTGAPMTWLSYNVWQYGPVSEDIYFSKMEGYNKLSEFVRFDILPDNTVVITPIAEFSNDEFCELDIEIINGIVEKYGSKTAKQLVDMTHAAGSLWERTKSRHGIQFTESNKTSDITLNFVDLIENDGFKKSVYYGTVENIELASTLI
ncbi:hypothetical protein AGMMS49965_03180 [Bacteroidia bacterium]|nr:hypothetical protein AGMMS49965_03180 [Bacteroidia bacterium]